MTKKLSGYLMIILVIPILIIIGVIILNDRQYDILSIIIAIISCIPFYILYEQKNKNTLRLIITAVMIALSVTGRIIFAAIPAFKPVTAIVIITGMYMGPETGFLTGSLSAIISNMYFGQGPWTPFQMFVWGIIGFAAGIFLRKKQLKNLVILYFYAALSGIAFSMVMDVWTVINQNGEFNLPKYKMVLITSLPYMFLYAISNIIFLTIMAKPIGKKLDRITKKYDID